MSITKDRIHLLFEHPIKDAAKILGISKNHLKRCCRRFGIDRWPYRKIKSLKHLKDRVSICEERSLISVEIEKIKAEPNNSVSQDIKSLLNKRYKSACYDEPVLIPVAAMQQDEWISLW